MLYTGIDLHEKSVVLTTLDTSGGVVRHGKLPTDPLRIARYFAAPPSETAAMIEATGGWYWLADLLRESGVDLQLAHAKYLKAIALRR